MLMKLTPGDSLLILSIKFMKQTIAIAQFKYVSLVITNLTYTLMFSLISLSSVL